MHEHEAFLARNRLGVWGWYAGTLAVLASAAACVAIVGSASFNADIGVLIPQVALSLYFGARLSQTIARGEIRPIAGSFWLFCFTALGIAPLTQAALNQYAALVDRSYLLPALLAIALGAVVWDIGYTVQATRPAAQSCCKPRVRSTISGKRVAIVAGVGVIGAGYYVQKTGLANLFKSRGDVSGALQSSGVDSVATTAFSGIVVAVAQVPVFVTFAFLTCFLLRAPERRNDVRLILAWVALLGVNILVNNPISNPRNWFVTILLGLLFGLPGLRWNHYRLILAGIAVTALLVFPYSDYFRVQSEYRKPIEVKSALETLATKDYDQMIMTANAMWWIDSRGGHTNGGQELGALLFFVPRPVWPGKPIDTGIEIGRAMSSSNVNLSSPLWSEFWVDFGYPGVFFGFLGFGLLSGKADRRFLDGRNPHRRDVLLVDLAVPALAGYEFIVLRGPLLQSMARLAVLLAIYWYIRDVGKCRPDQDSR